MANWKDDFELASNYTDDTLAQQAASTASTAASEASAAKSDAASAKTTATTAASTASAADTKATQAASAAATADSKATEAATTANTAASTATQAKTAATTAQTKAEAADGKADDALDAASTAADAAAAADTKATTAASDAASAKTTANGAASTASTAKTTADGAASTAATAKSTADTAKSTADTAKTTATAADTKAGEAKTAAAAADTKATEAKDTAMEAKETADATANYFMADNTGAYVASVEGNHDSGKNLKLSSDGLAIRNDTTEIAAFTPTEIRLGHPTSNVTLMGGRMIIGDNGMGSGFPAIFSKATDTAKRSEVMFVPYYSNGVTDLSKTSNIYTGASHTFNTFGAGSQFVISDSDVVAGSTSLLPVTETATWNGLTCTITKFGPIVSVTISGHLSSAINAWSTFNFGLTNWVFVNAKPAREVGMWYQAYPTKIKMNIIPSSYTFQFMVESGVQAGNNGDMGCSFVYSTM